jgi:hypothetical protein
VTGRRVILTAIIASERTLGCQPDRGMLSELSSRRFPYFVNFGLAAWFLPS